jgi:hypothetical protein
VIFSVVYLLVRRLLGCLMVLALWGARSLQPFELGRRWQLGQGMMADHAHPSALPDVRPDLHLAGPARPVNGVQGHRVARAAA